MSLGVGLGRWARAGLGRVVPDPMSVAIGLTMLVIAAAVVAGRPLTDLAGDWSGPQGLWSMLPFAMQICLSLTLGAALVRAPVVHRALHALIGVARTPRQLVALTAATSVGLALINWSVGLIGGALLAAEAGRVARARTLRLHFPLVCAAGYSGLMVWHGGASGSAPLKAAQLGDQVEVLGPSLGEAVGAIPLSSSVGSALNLVVSGGLLVLAPLTFVWMTPVDDAEAEPAPDVTDEPKTTQTGRGLLGRGLGAMLLLAAVTRASSTALDFNTVNLVLLAAALLAHPTLTSFQHACTEGLAGCAGVAIQFPLYGGIMGVMTASGLSSALASALTRVGASGLLLAAFGSAGLLNLLVPSGGGQWVVQGPILMATAIELGVEPAHVLLAFAYGDQWTNMLQPFWALPLLAVTGVKAREIAGYCAVWMGIGGLWMAGALTVVALRGAFG